jgi:tryptophanyl-tRNA synthetase
MPAPDGDEPHSEFDPSFDADTEIDYQRLLDEFGADRVTSDQRERFPEPTHPLVRRGVFYAGRDLERFLDAATAGNAHSIVTGVGPSGPMHIGHVVPLYFARYLQEATGARVYVPLSDDEKHYTRDLSFAEIGEYTSQNLRDILAVGFDPERTRIVVDTADADVVYPVASALAADVTPATVRATYGDPANVGAAFYPAVQAAHLLLPQLVAGEHPTLVPVAADQDPHIRVCRDLAAKECYPVTKPAALLSTFLPGLGEPGKMSSSDDAPSVLLTDDRETVRAKVREHAHSGGKESAAAHREYGGDPDADVAYRLLYAFFEEDDDRVAELARSYRAGELLSGELKDIAAECIADFLESHQRRRADLGDLGDEMAPYRLTATEQRTARRRAGLAPTANTLAGR